jgi:hypothetical protein
VWESADAVVRAVTRLYPDVRFDLDGQREASVAIERQDLDEILGNLVENAAKYGGGSVFITIDAVPTDPKFCDIWVEDDGMGIPEAERERIFDRGARLDTGKPGTGLGLAIVRDVAELYGGAVTLSKAKTSAACSRRCAYPRQINPPSAKRGGGPPRSGGGGARLSPLPWMRIAIGIQQSRRIHPRVDLRGRQAGMPQQFLQTAQVRARAQQVRGKAVAQGMGRGRGRQAQRHARAGHRALHHAGRQRPALGAAKQGASLLRGQGTCAA